MAARGKSPKVPPRLGTAFREPPEDRDEMWTGGVLVGGMASEPDPILLARSYTTAARELVRAALDGGEAWVLTYPILFLYRHAIELYLKRTVPKHRFTHRLEPLIDDFVGHVREVWKQTLPDKVVRDLRTLSRIDPDGQAFRYTTKKGKDGGVEEQLLEGEYWVDLAQLRDFADRLFPAVERVIFARDTGPAPR